MRCSNIIREYVLTRVSDSKTRSIEASAVTLGPNVWYVLGQRFTDCAGRLDGKFKLFASDVLNVVSRQQKYKF